MTFKLKSLLKSSYLRRTYIILFVCWSAALLVFTFLMYDFHSKEIWKLAVKECQTNFDKDVLYRLWASQHGGVYVPVTEKTSPNPNLSHIPERDITTPSGKKLTLVNPAYMTRQVYELGEERFQYKGHITSLNPIRKENAPDSWEAEVLKSFEKGVKKKIELAPLNNETHIRFMLPFVTEKSCLKCHAKQGYKVGDVRGGISVSLPWKNFENIFVNEMQYQIIVHFVLWLIGVAGLYISYVRMKKNSAEKDLLFAELKHDDTLLNSLLNGIHESALLIDRNGIVLAANDTVDQRINLGKKNIIGKNVFSLLEEDVAESRKKQVESLLKTKKPVHFEDVRNGKNIENYLTPIFDENGEVSEIALVGFDVTQQKRNEHSLRESEERFKLMFQNAASGMVLVSPSFKFVKINNAFSSMLGYSESELIGRSFQEITHPEDILVGDVLAKELIAGTKEAIQLEKRFINKNGNIVWVLVSAAVIRMENNLPLNIVAQIVDITERRNAQTALKESEEKFRMMFANVASGMVLVTPEFLFVKANAAFCDLVGYSESELIGKSFQDITFEEDKNISKEVIISLLKGDIEKVQFEKRYVHKNGSIVWGFVSAAVLRDKNNNPVNLVTQILDITKQKKALEALQESEERFSNIFYSNPVAQSIISTKGELLAVNDACCKQFGYTREELIGNNPDNLNLWVKEEEKAKAIEKISSDGYIKEMEISIKIGNGEIRNVLFSVEPILWKGIPCTINSTIDITERKKNEYELEKHRQHLEELVEERTEEIDAINKQLQEALYAEKQLNNLKSRFISTASHEFRTPLTAVLTSAELIQKYQDKWGKAKVNEHLDRIKNSVDYLTKLMTDVLEVSKAEAGKLNYTPSDVNLFELCGKVINDINIHYNEKINFTYKYLIERKNFTLDRKQTELIISNLLTNAVKYSPNGGNVNLTVSLNENLININVADEGIGIPNEEIPRLFEAFHRAKNTNDIQGTGLGLSIVKNAVELQKGKINVESTEGSGTIFTVELPI